jgi:hypothetical protein
LGQRSGGFNPPAMRRRVKNNLLAARANFWELLNNLNYYDRP